MKFERHSRGAEQMRFAPKGNLTDSLFCFSPMHWCHQILRNVPTNQSPDSLVPRCLKSGKLRSLSGMLIKMKFCWGTVCLLVQDAPFCPEVQHQHLGCIETMGVRYCEVLCWGRVNNLQGALTRIILSGVLLSKF